MIGKLKGRISEIHGTEALIETPGGVFYWTFVTPDILTRFTEDVEVEFYTYHSIKEDSQTLFAFDTYEAYRVYMYLISVDGVGPKTAYTISCTSTPDTIRQAVQRSDVTFFEKIKGIGKKTAQRILVDLSDKMGTTFDLADAQKPTVNDMALDALISLGFKQKEAYDVLGNIDQELPLEDIVKQALQQLSRVS